jgi:tetratricopeptide (TPR) repeat protein
MKFEALLILLPLIALSIWRRRDYLAATLIFIAAILPVSGITPFAFQRYSTVADRYVYLAMLGIALAIATALRNIAWQKWIAPLGIAVVLLMGLSVRQTLVWRDTLSLFTHAIEVNPNSLAANRSLGFFWAQNHDDSRAVRYYARADVLYPQDPTNHYDYANLLLRHGEIEKAIAHYSEAIRYEPDNPVYYLNYGVALISAHRPADALEAFTQASEIDPNNVDAYQNAGLVLEQMGAIDPARQAFMEALKRDPNRAIPRQHLQRLMNATTHPAPT